MEWYDDVAIFISFNGIHYYIPINSTLKYTQQHHKLNIATEGLTEQDKMNTPDRCCLLRSSNKKEEPLLPMNFVILWRKYKTEGVLKFYKDLLNFYV
jgi:hypothetical protein